MDDMNGFDRQLASVVLRRVGPSEPVDDAAIFTAITATQSPKWRFQSMFSATKFVVAGVIVALFGGILLSGVLTQQNSAEPLPPVGASASIEAEATAEVESAEPESSIESDLLPGVDLVTEEVEPGVFRVLSDGVRELSSVPVRELSRVPVGAAADDEAAFLDFVLSPNVAAGRASVWWFGPDGYFRLGDDRTHAWDWDELGPYSGVKRDIEVAPDETLWLAERFFGLRAFDGASWAEVQTPSHRPTDTGNVAVVEIGEGGTVWSAWKETEPRKRHVVGRLIDGAWERFGGQLPCTSKDGVGSCGMFFDGLSLSDDGSPWVITGEPPALFRHVSEGWRRVDTPRGVPVWFAVAPDGTRWVQLRRENNLVLARHDGDAWTVHDTRIDTGRSSGHLRADLRAAPDGGLWANLVEWPRAPGDCRGVTRFDEGGPRHFLGDLCVLAMDVAPDGKVWLQAGEIRDMGSQDRIYDSLGPTHTYVITPEAVAATE